MRKAVVILLMLAFGVAAAQVEVSASLSRAVVMVGDTATLTVSVSYPESVRVGFAVPQDSVLGGFAVLGVKLDTVASADKMKHLKMKYKLIYFSVGDNIIPPIGVVVAHSNGTIDTLLTQPIRVFFVSLVPDTLKLDSLKSKIRDIKPPLTVPINYARVAKAIVFAIILFAIVLVALLLWHLKTRGISIAEFIAPKRPPWEVALMELDALAESGMLERGEFKDYFDKLTDILREYIEKRFGIAALELSTTEIMENLRPELLDLDAVMAAKFVDTTGELLRFADMVKFAKFQPAVEDGYEAWRKVRELITMTIPKTEEEGAEGTPEVPSQSGGDEYQQPRAQ